MDEIYESLDFEPDTEDDYELDDRVVIDKNALHYEGEFIARMVA